MNTQSHAILTFFLIRCFLGKQTLRLKGLHAAIFTGAITPDLPIYTFFFWYTFFQPTPQQTIWNELYFQKSWHLLFSLFHSFPVWGAATAACFLLKKTRAALFCLAAFIAAVEDFLLHHDDGHAHFFPFSDFRFSSPVSYWDPNHYGRMASGLEIACALTAAVWIFKHLESRWGQGLLVVTVTTLLATNSLWAFLFKLF